MSRTATEEYIDVLSRLGFGELGVLRTHAGQSLEETVAAFDLFTGMWWPLRQKNQRAPRREVAWLIAKLYAFCPVQHSAGDTLARQMGLLRPHGEHFKRRFRKQFDTLLSLSRGNLEWMLRWAIGHVASRNGLLDWVELTDDLSIWEREATRLKWAEQYLTAEERVETC